MKQFLVILRGVTASGKSTLSKRLRNFEEKVVWLKVDNFKDFFAEDSTIALEFVHGSAIATLHYVLDQGFSVAMDGVFQDTRVIDDAVKLAELKGITILVYQITCSLQTLQERDRSRDGVKEGCRKTLGDEAIAQIYEKLQQTYYPNARQLDTENLSIEQCIEKITNDIHNEQVTTKTQTQSQPQPQPQPLATHPVSM